MSNMPLEPRPDDVRYETFVARFAKHEPDLRRIIRSLLPTWTDADEVLQ
jgi:DNA-directed RNA polymerase specialized sigma24 family protein